MENRNQHDCWRVNKVWTQFWPRGYRGHGQAGGTAGERVSSGLFRAAERRIRPCRAHDEGEGA
jgi:hypothetical protein